MVLKDIDQHRWSLGLDRMRKALDVLGHPEKDYPHVLVAGTNGKGSTCVYLESMLLAAGKTVGTTLSPHLTRLTERFRINGREVQLSEINRIRTRIEPELSSLDLTYFEWCVVLAVVLFAKHKVDAGIFEIGLGGRFDASNALDPALSLVSEISIDHTDYLGKTVSRIAREKAAIARPGRPLLTTATGRGLKAVRAEAEAIGAKVIEITGPVVIPQTGTGRRQALNATLAYRAADLLGAHPGGDDLAYALRTAFLSGRIEKLGERIIMDVAHNHSSMLVLIKYLKKIGFKGVGVMGILADKDFRVLVEMMKKVCTHLFIAPVNSPRSWGSEEMKSVESLGSITICESVTEAFARAVQTGLPLVITGSFYTVGEVREDLICHGWPA